MARIGAIAAAPFVGDQFVSLYLGDERVPTVPGKPVVESASEDDTDVTVLLGATTPNGGNAITGYNLYVSVDGVNYQPEPTGEVGTTLVFGSVNHDFAYPVRLSAVNAIGEGPLSAPFTVV